MAEITQKLLDGVGLQTAIGIMANYSDNMDRGVIGGYNQSFPLTAATKGNVYYHKTTNRYYICINNYSGSSLTNPNSSFEELSVYTNRQRLDSLDKISTDIVVEPDTRYVDRVTAHRVGRNTLITITFKLNVTIPADVPIVTFRGARFTPTYFVVCGDPSTKASRCFLNGNSIKFPNASFTTSNSVVFGQVSTFINI